MSTAESVGSVEAAVRNAARLLESDPALAAEQAAEILKAVPNQPLALLLLGVARRTGGDAAGALQVLQNRWPATHPQWALAHYELALALRGMERTAEALGALRRAVELKPDMADAWRALGDQLIVAGDAQGADAAYAQNIKASTKDPNLLKAAAALCENQIPQAEALLRAHLKKYPTDVAAIRMFAEVAARLQRYQDAEKLLARCLELAPSFSGARHNYALVLHRQNKPEAALREVDNLLAADPRNPGYNNLKAAILARIGELDDSIEIYAGVLSNHSQHPKIWMSYGHALKTKGREAESIDAYRKSIDLCPSLGEAYWSLANLKTVRFTPAELHAMTEQVARTGLSEEDRFHLHFALGKALEDEGDYARAFEHYADGNRLRRSQIIYDADDIAARLRRCRALITRQFLEARSGYGATAPDPIFIVGLPRAGSTLIEQILSSHSQVEGTMELPDIPAIAKGLFDRGSEIAGSGLLGGAGGLERRSMPRVGGALSCAHAHSTQIGGALFHRQDAEQFRSHRPHSFGAAERQNHRCAKTSAGLLLFRVQAAFRARAIIFLRSARHRPLLSRLRRAHGALRFGPAGPDPPGDLRIHDRGHRERGTPIARVLRIAL